MTPEGKVKAAVRRVIAKWNTAERGAVHVFTPATYGYGSSGEPDIIGCLNGFFFGIECKANGGKPTALQRKALSNIESAGGIVWVVDEKSLAYFERDFDRWAVLTRAVNNTYNKYEHLE